MKNKEQNNSLTLDEEFQLILNEGVHDKGTFKAVFLAGGPGSGKDHVMKHTLQGHGLTEINSDHAFEMLMDKNNLSKKMPDDESSIRNGLRDKAKNTTELRQHLALNGRNGLVINGTGSDHKKIKSTKERLEKLGYDTSMIMVHADDEVSRRRNIERGQRGGRSVPETVRSERWKDVQEARRHHAKNFGNNYHEYDNSHDNTVASPELRKQKQEELDGLFDRMHEFVNKPPENEQSKKWIAGELARNVRRPIPQKGTVKLPPKESMAHQQATEAGLQYYGQGRYGKNKKVTHYALNDNLVELEKEQPKKKKTISEEFSEFFNIKDNQNVTMDQKPICEETGSGTGRSLREGSVCGACGCGKTNGTSSCGCATRTVEGNSLGSGTQAQKTLLQTKGKSLSEFRAKKETQVKESIDMGIEPGCSMSSSNEKLDGNGKVTAASGGNNLPEVKKRKTLSLFKSEKK